VDAVELEIQELADAQPAGAREQQGVGGQAARRVRQRLAEASVGVRRQVAGQGRGSLGMSERNSSRREGASSQPHSVISARKFATA